MNKSIFAAALLAATPLLAQDCSVFATSVSLGNGDDVEFDSTIGFAFPFAGTTFDSIRVSTNGICYLGNGGVLIGTGDFQPTTADFEAEQPAIAPMWTDLECQTALGGDSRVVVAYLTLQAFERR